MTPKIITKQQALQKLEAMCARAEHCEGELREKLRKWNISRQDSDEIIDSLRDGRYVDDARFAKAYVRDKLRFNHWGRKKIAMGLYAKRVSKELINEALAEIDQEEYQGILAALLQTKVRQNPELPDSLEGRQKLFRFALSRGFESSLTARIIKNLKN